MSQTVKNNRDEVVGKLAIINKIIRKGYDTVISSIKPNYKDYCLSIKNKDYFQIREQLMSELYPLVYSN
jgi:hypothetical protein